MFALPRLTTWLALLLAAVLVLTQTLGVVHGITHGAAGALLHSYSGSDDHDHDHVKTPSTPHFLTTLFSSHQEASDCRLYDQARHEGAVVMALPWALPALPPGVSVPLFQGKALARWAALFDARGPPLTA